MTILGCDVSHWQGSPDWAQVKASGRDFCVLKATEGTGYVDPTFAVNRRNAHAASLIVGLYHFARAGDAAAEAAYFLRTIGTLQPGEFVVLDWEVPGANPPAWCKQWLDTVYSQTGVRPMIYMNQSAVRGSNWSTVAADYALWLAVYDNVLTFPAVPYWGVPAMKQYSDRGSVPGIGSCDVNVFNGSAAQLLAFGKGAPTPPPPSGGFLMALTDAQQQAIYAALIESDGKGPQNNFAWLFNQVMPPLAALQQQVAALESQVAALQSGGVDPAAVAKLVLAGLNGASLNVTAATA